MAQTHKGAQRVAAKRLGLQLADYLQHVATGEKWCFVCRCWKLQALFGKDSTRGDKLSPKCLSCARAQYIPRKRGPSPLKGIKHSVKTCQRMAAAQQGAKNHRWKGGISLHRVEPPEKRLAKRAVNHAIEADRLAKSSSLPCIECGAPAKEYHHHLGYEKPHWLDVQALCRKCHRLHHR